MVLAGLRYAQFFYRSNGDGTTDSICGVCFVTVVTAKTFAELTLAEKTHLLPQSSKPLLLGMGIDVGPNAEGYDVEERNPSLFGQEFLGKCQCQWGGDPADAHDGPETGAHGGADLVPGAGAGDDGHR